MKKRSKRYRKAVKSVEAGATYSVEQAVALLQGFAAPKFDETVDLNLRLGIDPKKSEQIVRGSVSLPRGIGKSKRVIVFAEGDKAREAEEAGAVEVGSEALAAKILAGWTDFDVAIATPDMMRHVGKLGRVLGPQGKMPSPKSGTVTADVKSAVAEFAAGKIEFRNDAHGNLHAPVGKRSFPAAHLVENINALLEHVKHLRPATAKGSFIVTATVAATMSPGLRLAV